MAVNRRVNTAYNIAIYPTACDFNLVNSTGS
jgi:hypothetical protein